MALHTEIMKRIDIPEYEDLDPPFKAELPLSIRRQGTPVTVSSSSQGITGEGGDDRSAAIPRMRALARDQDTPIGKLGETPKEGIKANHFGCRHVPRPGVERVETQLHQSRPSSGRELDRQVDLDMLFVQLPDKVIVGRCHGGPGKSYRSGPCASSNIQMLLLCNGLAKHD